MRNGWSPAGVDERKVGIRGAGPPRRTLRAHRSAHDPGARGRRGRIARRLAEKAVVLVGARAAVETRSLKGAAQRRGLRAAARIMAIDAHALTAGGRAVHAASVEGTAFERSAAEPRAV